MEEKNMTKISVIIATAVVAAIVLGGIYFLVKSPAAVEPKVDRESAVPAQVVVGDKNEKVFDLSAKPFEFSQKEIRVKKGDTVRINLVVAQGFHDFAVDEFGARTKQLKAGESDSIVFVADKIGTFEFYCSVLTHRQMGMVGRLIVE